MCWMKSPAAYCNIIVDEDLFIVRRYPIAHLYTITLSHTHRAAVLACVRLDADNDDRFFGVCAAHLSALTSYHRCAFHTYMEISQQFTL